MAALTCYRAVCNRVSVFDEGERDDVESNGPTGGNCKRSGDIGAAASKGGSRGTAAHDPLSRRGSEPVSGPVTPEVRAKR